MIRVVALFSQPSTTDGWFPVSCQTVTNTQQAAAAVSSLFSLPEPSPLTSGLFFIYLSTSSSPQDYYRTAPLKGDWTGSSSSPVLFQIYCYTTSNFDSHSIGDLHKAPPRLCTGAQVLHSAKFGPSVGHWRCINIQAWWRHLCCNIRHGISISPNKNSVALYFFLFIYVFQPHTHLQLNCFSLSASVTRREFFLSFKCHHQKHLKFLKRLICIMQTWEVEEEVQLSESIVFHSSAVIKRERQCLQNNLFKKKQLRQSRLFSQSAAFRFLWSRWNLFTVLWQKPLVPFTLKI